MNFKLTLTFLMGSLALSQVAQAETSRAMESTKAKAEQLVQTAREGKPSIGLRLGVAENSGNFTGGFDYGAEIGAEMYPQISAVAEFSGTNRRSKSQ